MLSQMVSEITAGHKVNDEIQVLSVIECIIHIDEEGVIKLT